MNKIDKLDQLYDKVNNELLHQHHNYIIREVHNRCFHLRWSDYIDYKSQLINLKLINL